MKIEIHQISSPHYWYNNKIGEQFEVEDSGTPGDFRITEGEHAGKHILKSDCRQIILVMGERLTA